MSSLLPGNLFSVIRLTVPLSRSSVSSPRSPSCADWPGTSLPVDRSRHRGLHSFAHRHPRHGHTCGHGGLLREYRARRRAAAPGAGPRGRPAGPCPFSRPGSTAAARTCGHHHTTITPRRWRSTLDSQRARCQRSSRVTRRRSRDGLGWGHGSRSGGGDRGGSDGDWACR